MPSDYDVGYRKPPKHTQFKSGQSGNPAGRPKGAKNLKTDLEEELCELIIVHEGGNAKTVSKQRAMLKSLTAKAVRGDPRAAAIIIEMMYRLLHEDDAEDTSRGPSPEDEEILDHFKKRVLRESGSAPKNEQGSAAATTDGVEDEEDE